MDIVHMQGQEKVMTQSTAIAPVAPKGTFAMAIQPRDYREALDFCTRLSKSSIVAKSLRDDPMAIMVAIQFGERHGFDIMGSVQNIAVINGKPSLYGDALLVVCRSSPQWEWMTEDFTGTMSGKDAVATCTVKRKGEGAVVQEFSWERAQRAKLLNKPGPWQEYPERMMQMRARGFALRDCFADLLSGAIAAEEAEDYSINDQHGRPATRPRGPVVDVAVPPADALPLTHYDPATGEVLSKDRMLRLIYESASEGHLQSLGKSLKPQIKALPEVDRAELTEVYKAMLVEHRQRPGRGSQTERMLSERKQEDAAWEEVPAEDEPR